jgi:thymidylate synthase
MKNYLDMLKDILENGFDETENIPEGKTAAECRTGVFARSLFDYTLTYDLSDGKLPMVTTKKQPWKSTVAELLWCMNGERHLSGLVRRGCYFWNKWPYARLQKMIRAMNPRGQDESETDYETRLEHSTPTEEGFGKAMKLYAAGKDLPSDVKFLLSNVDDMGPLYGYQWRNWTDYSFATTVGKKGSTTDIYQEGKGIDQLDTVVNKIRHNPNDRGMLVTSWNVSDLDEMILRPCHACHINHYVRGEYLDVKMVQRSCDTPIGVPVNITFYALYTMILAKMTGKKPGRLTWSGDNVHIYSNQIEAVKELIEREPRELPTVTIPDFKSLDDLKDAKVDDFILDGYDPHPKIVIPVSV